MYRLHSVWVSCILLSLQTFKMATDIRSYIHKCVRVCWRKLCSVSTKEFMHLVLQPQPLCGSVLYMWFHGNRMRPNGFAMKFSCFLFCLLIRFQKFDRLQRFPIVNIHDWKSKKIIHIWYVYNIWFIEIVYSFIRRLRRRNRMIKKSKMASKLDLHSNRYWFWLAIFVPFVYLYFSLPSQATNRIERAERESCAAQGDSKIL